MGPFIEKLPLGVKMFITHPLKKQLPKRFGIFSRVPRSLVFTKTLHGPVFCFLHIISSLTILSMRNRVGPPRSAHMTT